MGWLTTVATALGVLVLLAPVIALVLTVLVLVPLAHLAPAATALARRGFRCPVTKRRVRATFLTASGVDRPLDVLECSEFDPRPVGCAKACLATAATRPAPSLMVPRYALLADGLAARDAGDRSSDDD